MDMSDSNKHSDANLDAAASEEERNLSRSNVRSSLAVVGESVSG